MRRSGKRRRSSPDRPACVSIKGGAASPSRRCPWLVPFLVGPRGRRRLPENRRSHAEVTPPSPPRRRRRSGAEQCHVRLHRRGLGAGRRPPGGQPRPGRPVGPPARGRRRPEQQPQHLQPLLVQRGDQRREDGLGLLDQALGGPGAGAQVRPPDVAQARRRLLRRPQPAQRLQAAGRLVPARRDAGRLRHAQRRRHLPPL